MLKSETKVEMPKIQVCLNDFVFNDFVSYAFARLKQKFKPDELFDAFSVFEEANASLHPFERAEWYDEVATMLRYCNKFHTPEVVAYFKSLEPSDNDVVSLMKRSKCVVELMNKCQYCRTKEMFEFLKSLDPTDLDILDLMLWSFVESGDDLSFSDMLEYFKSLDPSPEYVGDLLAVKEEIRTPEMIEYWKSCKPNIHNVMYLMRSDKDFRTPEMWEYFKSFGPKYNDVKKLVTKCRHYRTKEVAEYLRSLPHDPKTLNWFIRQWLPEAR